MKIGSAPTALTCALVLALAATDSALAERGEDSFYRPPTFGQLDFNADAVLDRGEVQGRSPLAGQWERFDTDRDGKISEAEFAAFESFAGPTPTEVPTGPPDASYLGQRDPGGAGGSDPRFTALDIDGDGVLSKGEAGGHEGLLDEWWQADQNKDNQVDRAEFAAFEAAVP
jgi:hypothetical protein